MAFATSNVKKDYFGSLKVITGDWTGSVGDAAGSISVEGGRVYLAEFNQQKTGARQERVPISVSVGEKTTTISVYNQAEVSAGRFIIIHG